MISRGSRAARPAQVEPDPVEEIDAPSIPGFGGRSVRVPLGYVYLGAAACLLLLIGSYTLGHWRGEQTAEQRFDDRLLAATSEECQNAAKKQQGEVEQSPHGARDSARCPGSARV